MKDEIAILMAAGMGTRMLPLTKTTPKPLVKVHGESMIETVIASLQKRGVKHIYVVVGYLKEKFKFLETKYSNLTLVENKEYTVKNNISSIYAVADLIRNNNCFICEADLYVSDKLILLADLNKSCYYGKTVKGHSDDWLFYQDETGRITKVCKGGDDLYNMVGVSYFTAEDATIISKAVKEAYKLPGHEQLYWDEIVDKKLDKVDMVVHPVQANQIIEIDTIAELEKIDPNYKELNEV